MHIRIIIKFIIASVLVLGFKSLSFAEAGASPDIPNALHINIVDDLAEWPPYTFFARNGATKTNKVEGFSVDVITAILKARDIEFSIELLPFKRAMKLTEIGEQYQIILNASYVADRAEKFYYAIPHYDLRHVAFFSALKYPKGLKLKDIDDLNENYKVCGLRGYSYGSAGADDSKINMNFSNYDQLIQVLHERPEICDLFIEGYELMAGFKSVGNDLLADEELMFTDIPGLTPKGYHI